MVLHCLSGAIRAHPKFYLPGDSTPVAFALTMVAMTSHLLTAAGFRLALTIGPARAGAGHTGIQGSGVSGERGGGTGNASGCASCHHNGDAARALFMASHRGDDTAEALRGRPRFLNAPAGWASNKGHGEAMRC